MVDVKKLDEVIRARREMLERNQIATDALTQLASGTYIDVLNAINKNSAIQQILDSAKRYNEAMRIAEGPLSEMRRLGLFDDSSILSKEQEKYQNLLATFEAKFILPEVRKTASILAKFETDSLRNILDRYSKNRSSLQKAMELMHTPWLNRQAISGSLSAFAALQGIGNTLSAFPTFEDKVCNAIRSDLGDWRDTLSWPKSITSDLIARSKFYADLGFDTDLTNFPAPAFQESIEIADLTKEPPLLVEKYGPPVPLSDENEHEDSLLRTIGAYEWLLRFESQLRQFIDFKMRSKYGEDWPKHRLPKNLFGSWREKKQRAMKAGAKEQPLIAYADFTDYQLIICKKDNWREVFEHIFARPENVRESFQRLHMIRLDTMHARPITQDDELLLYVETKRMAKLFIFQ